MKREELLHRAIGEIDDELISEAIKPQRLISPFMIKSVALAASFFLVFMGVLLGSGLLSPPKMDNAVGDAAPRPTDTPESSTDNTNGIVTGEHAGYVVSVIPTGKPNEYELVLEITREDYRIDVYLFGYTDDGRTVIYTTSDGRENPDAIYYAPTLYFDGEICERIPKTLGRHTIRVVFDEEILSSANFKSYFILSGVSEISR